VSSFGYSGTIAHAVLQAAVILAAPPSSAHRWTAAVALHRRAFSWGAQPYHQLSLRGGGSTNGLPRTVTATKTRAAAASVQSVLALVRNFVDGAMDADTPLMEAGLDSLSAVELRNQLQQQTASDVTLPATLIFDFPTARDLASALVPSPAFVGVSPAAAAGRLTTSVIALGGSSSLLPRHARGVGDMWRMVASGSNVVGEVPATRWELRTPPADESAAARVKHGGFVAGAERFDHRCFGVSPAEAAAMDPQQRLLLEEGYTALHSAGLTRNALRDSMTTVTVGISWTEFRTVLAAGPQATSVYAATGWPLAIASGRLSYLLGLRGPCLSVETACSSSLVAAHVSARALQHGERGGAAGVAGAALAAGVNLMLSTQLVESAVDPT
jgi:acyl transferase domain-containing protein